MRKMKTFTYRVVNAFVNNDNSSNNTPSNEEKMKGNPAAVIVLSSAESENTSREEKQAIARKLGLSETAFVWEVVTRTEKSRKYFNIQWFSPTCEVGLCGHASLASAACVFNDISADSGGRESSGVEIVFVYDSGKGELVLERCEESGAITMSFPASPPVLIAEEEASRRMELVREAFGDKNKTIEALPVYENSIGDTFIYLDESSVPSMDEIYFDSNRKVDYEKLKEVGGRGVIVTALSNNERVDCDFVSRFFGPNIGIDEDPVTGSAHCGLAPFYSSEKIIPPSATDEKFLRGYQKSTRGGLVLCRTIKDRVELRGFCNFDKTDAIEIEDIVMPAT